MATTISQGQATTIGQVAKVFRPMPGIATPMPPDAHVPLARPQEPKLSYRYSS